MTTDLKDVEVDSTLPALDYELLFDLIKWAEHDEDARRRAKEKGLFGGWDQNVWAYARKSSNVNGRDFTQKEACGTAHCQAGGAVILSGYRMIFHSFTDHKAGELDDLDASFCIKTEPTGEFNKKGRPLYRDVPGAVPVGISEEAEDLLGLASYEASQYFRGGNDIQDLKEYANGFCATRGIPLMFPDEEIELTWR